MFFHSSSYTANPIACAAARANLAIWRDEPVLDRIADLSRRQRARHAPLADQPMFRNVRQLGTVTALELAEPHSDYLSALGPTLLRSEEHTSELQSLMRISYAVFCLKKKKTTPKPKVTS